MEQLIKITTEPMRMVRFSQNARIINSDSVDMERRKAIARQNSFRNSIGQGTVSVEDITRINSTFSKKNVSTEVSNNSFQQISSHQMQSSSALKVSIPSQETSAAETNAVETVAANVSSSQPVADLDISVQNSSSYAAQRGSFEMRVSRGDLTYLPPLVMTIITQRPQVHVEYLGGFNYVPPIDGDPGGNVNLFT